MGMVEPYEPGSIRSFAVRSVFVVTGSRMFTGQLQERIPVKLK